MKHSLPAHKGFTLVEVLIVMAMVGVVMGAVFSLYLTNSRTAHTSDETVEVQQNLRIAMDMVTRDLRMAGFLVDTSVTTPTISAISNDSGPKNTAITPLGQDILGQNPQLPGSDRVTMNMASASGSYARIDSDITPSGTPAVFPVTPAIRPTQAGDGDVLRSNDVVRIIRPLNNTQPGSEATFTVTAVVRQTNLSNDSGYVAPTVTLANATGATMTGVEYKGGDIIAKVNATDATTPSPNTVQYAVVTSAAAPATATTDPNCPENQRCLARRLNNETVSGNPVWQIVAQNIADFQLRYILDNDTVIDVPALSDPSSDLNKIKAVIVTIWGETQTTRLLSGDVPKIRQLSSIVKLRNRR